LRSFVEQINEGDNIFMRKVSGLAHIMMTMPKYQMK